MRSRRLFIALFALLFGVGIDAAHGVANCRPCPYSCNDLGLGKKDCSFINENRGVCCLDLTDKGLQIATAQQQVLDQQRRGAPANNAAPDRCPPGFKPSERKCTPQERAQGCKDIRTPGGLGCVNR